MQRSVAHSTDLHDVAIDYDLEGAEFPTGAGLAMFNPWTEADPLRPNPVERSFAPRLRPPAP